jgi:solute carrier family 13 (sodium-dependent dicarboxylate transporter), member 2/3/5
MNGLSHVLVNPGLLKLELMLHGIRLPMQPSLEHGGAVTGHALFGSAGDVDLLLPKGTWASVPVMRGLVRQTPYELVQQGSEFYVTAKGSEARTPVVIRPPSRVFSHRTSTGLPFGKFGTVHGPYMAISPTNRCSFLSTDDQCRFCGVGEEGSTHAPVPVDDVIEAIQIARSEHPIDMVYLSVGDLGTDDGGVLFLEPYVAAIKKHFDVLVAMDALPPSDNRWIDHAYAMGVDSVSYNLEIFDADRFERICPGPARTIGRERFLEALEYAATVFPSGGTTCHLIVGLEPLESTREGIDTLTAMGVLPILPLYRPFKGRDMRRDEAAEHFDMSREELIALHSHLYRAVRGHSISLNLVRDIAIVTTPLEGRFLAKDDGLLKSLQHKIMGTRWGRRTSAYMSDLRRALRVRYVEELN